MQDEDVEGFVIPVHRALTAPLLLGGVPRGMAILNGTFTAMLGLGMHYLWAFPVGVGIHLLAALAAKYDPQYFEVLQRHLAKKSYYYS